MTGLLNRTRTYTHADGSPLVVGLLACGDSHNCTNPAYGRGQSLALRMATMIVDALAASDDLESAARDYEAACAEQVVPWYQFSVMTDQMRAAAGVRPGSGPSTSDPFAALFGGGDPETVRLVMRVMNLLELPSALMTKLPELQARAAARPAQAPTPQAARVHRPSRDELLAVGV